MKCWRGLPCTLSPTWLSSASIPTTMVVILGLPTFEGNTARGILSPAKLALHMLLSLSTTSAAASSPPMSAKMKQRHNERRQHFFPWCWCGENVRQRFGWRHTNIEFTTHQKSTASEKYSSRNTWQVNIFPAHWTQHIVATVVHFDLI